MSPSSWFSLEPLKSSHYGENLRWFREIEPEQADTIEHALDDLHQYEFVQLGIDQYACRMAGEERPLYDPARFPSELNGELEKIRKVYRQGIELVAIGGSGLGYLAAHIEEEIRGKLGWGLLLLENRPALLAAQFCLFNCRSLLQSKQVFWVVGNSSKDTIQNVFRRYRFDLISPQRIYPTQERWLTKPERSQMQQIGMWIATTWNQTLPSLLQAQSRFIEEMKKPPRFDSGRLWSTATPEAYAHTPLMRSFLQGFQDAGWQTEFCEIVDRFASGYVVRENLLACVPDAILVCNSANENFRSEGYNRPRIIWILDHPRYFAGETFRDSLSPLDYVFYIDRYYGEALQQTRAKGCWFMPAIPSIARKGERRKDRAASIVFVGFYKDATPFYQSLSSSSRDELYALLDRLIENPTQLGHEAIASGFISHATHTLLQNKANEFTRNIHYRMPDSERQVDYFLYALANSRKRKQAVRALLDLGMVVYGPDSWLTLLGDRYASHYRGWLANDELADVYASADLVLNQHSLQCPTCLNPRDFDVLAAGGCLITDWVEDVDRGILQPGSDCVVYRGIDDLVEQVKNLLETPHQREQIREQGYATYRERHTPRHRALEIIHLLKNSTDGEISR